MKKHFFFLISCFVLGLISQSSLKAWNYSGHRMVALTALETLPPDFPAWAKTPEAKERIAFLSGEADRWRNTHDYPLQQYNGLDHYIDLEDLSYAGISLDTLTDFRYNFATQYATGRLAHADKFPAQEGKNYDHTREWPGMLPWAIAEYTAKIESAFSYLKALQEAGRPEEIANAEANIIYMMGVMTHYVGDGAQPLHVTVHHHGWVGENPQGYTTEYSIHSWIDAGFIAKAGITATELLPQVVEAKALDLTPRSDHRDPVFVATVQYLQGTYAFVEPLYKLQKEGKLKNAGPESSEGRVFIKNQLVRGAEMLGTLWVTAWRHAKPDGYLRAELLKRKSGEN